MTLPQAASESGFSVRSEPSPVTFPLEWILAKGSPPVQYRAIRDVAHLEDSAHRFPALVYSHFPGLRLAVSQGMDGTWNGKMLSVPSGAGDDYEATGTIPAVHRLLELGFAPDLPPIHAARRILFRLLAEDNDPAFLYDLAPVATDSERRRHGRLVLREAAAAVLAHLGFEPDPRLRGCANRMLARVGEYLASPLARDPWIRVGNRDVLAPDASPPSISLMVMLSHFTHYRYENHGFLEQLLAHLSHPPTAHGDVMQAIGAGVVRQPRLILGNPLSGRADDGALATTLFWLELLARIGFAERHEGWRSTFEHLLDSRDRDGVWRPPRGKLPSASTLPEAWPMFPLDPRRESDAVAAEVTMRLGVIARAAGRPIELV